jgi:hypothetical protein
MLHRTQQLRIDARQSRQGVGIDPIILAAALPDQTHVARMGHDGLVSQADQQPAYPRFADGTIPAAFKVTESTVTSKGVIIVNYERAGAVPTGSL